MNLFDTNSLQVALIEDSDMTAIEWIESYSEKFRVLIEGGITSLDEIKFFLYSN